MIAHLLTAVQDEVAEFQTDLPAPANHPWPPEVEDAAAVLLAASTRRRQQPGYGVTGRLRRDEAEVWQAFVTFAPYAYGAEAFDEQVSPIVEVNDEGTSVAIALTQEQFEAAARVIAPARLVVLGDRRRR